MRLEKYERAIIVFLAAVALAGIALAAYRKAGPGVRLEVKRSEIMKDEPPSVCEASAAVSGKVNVNEASLEELMKLKRVGKVLAQRIIDYRNSKGRFRSKEEIKRVNGIGESLFEDIKDNISL